VAHRTKFSVARIGPHPSRLCMACIDDRAFQASRWGVFSWRLKLHLEMVIGNKSHVHGWSRCSVSEHGSTQRLWLNTKS